MCYFCLYFFKMELIVNSLADLPKAAQQLLDFAGDKKIFVFRGDMGAGKTTFIKVLCRELGIEDVVSSPTYSIVNEYISPKGAVYHFDFYRIKNIQEAYDLGYEEYFYSGAICLIEWPELVAELLPENLVHVDISIANNTQRIFRIS